MSELQGKSCDRAVVTVESRPLVGVGAIEW